MSKSLTIKDIAKALNLSNSTVSRALKDSYQISIPVKKEVNKYASKHNYRPNLIAQSLKSKKSRTIGISLCSISNNFLAETISGIESVATENKYKIILTQNQESYVKEFKNIDLLEGHSVDGLLVSLSTETTDITYLKKLQNRGTPIVLFDRISNKIKTHKVTAANQEGSFNATLHLFQQNFKRIAHITSSPGLSITKERLDGYYDALKQCQLPIIKEYIKYCQHGGMIIEEVEDAINQLLSLPNPPNAIITASERITLLTVSILKQKGIKIPEQMALVGFSNFNAPDIIDPPLSTVTQPAFEMGKKAAEMLINLIESKTPVTDFIQIVLPTELIIRASSNRIK